MKKLIIFLAIVALIIGGYLYLEAHYYMKIPELPSDVYCPPGYVRDNTEKKCVKDDSVSVSTELTTKYLRAQSGWPPVVTHSTSRYSCTPQEDETGKTIERTIDGRIFCVKTITEGAAGSTYTTYTYSTASRDGNGIAMTNAFTLAFVHCGNYDEPIASECRNERETFNLDAIIAALM
jgi:hypothetical protein